MFQVYEDLFVLKPDISAAGNRRFLYAQAGIRFLVWKSKIGRSLMLGENINQNMLNRLKV